jgi:hypothetical protein
MKDSYRNPFSGVNAVQLDIDDILGYWCSPFRYKLFSGIKETDIFKETMNLVFMGGRSTGKSMFLRYWSYPVQFRKAQNENKKLRDIIKENKGIGFYFRMDGPALKGFQNYGLSEEHWAAVFTHYFELLVGREYLEVIKILKDEGSIETSLMNDVFLPKLCEQLDLPSFVSIEEVLKEFNNKIKCVDRFRDNAPFNKKEFKVEGTAFGSGAICFKIAELIKALIPLFKNTNIIILLDEYENFLEYQQVIINTLLKFTRPQIKFRIGMRLEGFRTTKVLSEKEDFIKETREYRKIVFEDILNLDKGYRGFLFDIAKKRLAAVQLLNEKGFTDIKEILSDSEDLEAEAIKIVGGDSDRIYNFFLKTYKIDQTALDLVRNPDNPLLELMNFIWLLKGISPEITLQSMTEYLNNQRTANAKKYRLDYVDKYKLTLTFLLNSIYKKKKQFYSFNTLAFLSSGIVGHFIELCRGSFANASWGNNDRLLIEGKIDPEFQSSAAYEYSNSEKSQINRIEDDGGKILRFVENMGNIFRKYHLDIRMRYPETNQFAVNIDALNDKELQKVMKAAIKWSVIQSKPRMQGTGPGEDLQNLYTLCRIFSPTFQISYRTRGGKSVELTEPDLSELVSNENADLTKHYPKEVADKDSKKDNLPLFSESYE